MSDRKTHRTRLLCWIAAMLCCCAAWSAVSTYTATLQHKGQMAPFFGDSAYIEAYQAAAPGDSIILSCGKFYPVDTIKKPIWLIGEYGIEDYFAYKVEIHKGPDGRIKDVRIQSDDVYIEGVFMGTVVLSGVRNFTMKRCYFYYLEGYRNYEINTNTLIEQCVLEHDRAIGNGVNHIIRNSYLYSVGYMNTPDNMATITNCFIRYYFYRHDTVPQGSTNYYSSSPYQQPYAVYSNNVLCLEATARDLPEKPFDQPLDAQFPAPSQYYNNYFYRINSPTGADPSYYIHHSFEPGCIAENNSVNLENASAIFCDSTHTHNEWGPECYNYLFDRTYEHPYEFEVLGSDGTPVGITGGEIGWQVYPGIPRFTYRSISSSTDYDGKLRVYDMDVKAEKAHLTDNPSVAQFEYWVDDILGEKQVIVLSERPGPNDTVSIPITEFDFSYLPAGEHVLYYRLQDTYGAYSPLIVRNFTRRNPYDNEMYLPYDATELEGEQKTANPTYSAYPTEIESQLTEMNCD